MGGSALKSSGRYPGTSESGRHLALYWPRITWTQSPDELRMDAPKQCPVLGLLAVAGGWVGCQFVYREWVFHELNVEQVNI